MTDLTELHLKQNLKALLKKRAMTASDLARKTGVAKSVISNWLSGQKPADIAKVHLVAKELSVTLEALCFEEDAASSSDLSIQFQGHLFCQDDQTHFDVIVRRRAHASHNTRNGGTP